MRGGVSALMVLPVDAWRTLSRQRQRGVKMCRVVVTVTSSAHATVRLPHPTLVQVTESGRAIRGAAGVTPAFQEGEAVIVEVGSDLYRFAYDALDPM